MTPDSGLLFWTTLYITISALNAVTVLHIDAHARFTVETVDVVFSGVYTKAAMLILVSL